ncbi:tyrosine phosphatase [Bacteroidia bacterium]|nr:tyrosine phosphatase [Bacteroidia bacterium]GHV70860.1 tyrosine phosphatase [Bacteroidia bacterium]
MIKWETFPPMEGSVNIYESFSPDTFNLYSPIAEAEIHTGYKNVYAMHSLNRSYFCLVFDKKYSVITAERYIPMQGLRNFRDLGGYYNSKNEQTQWGKLYRSGSLAEATLLDMKMLDNLGIKTIIDFRTNNEKFMQPYKYLAPQIINIPLRLSRPNIFFDKILSGEMKKGDVLIALQDVMASLLYDNPDYFIDMFDILLDKNNYPIVMNCSMGKERTGIASALILTALGIDWDQIVYDYLLSNDLIDYNSMLYNMEMYEDEPDIQETMTTMLRAHREDITWSFEKIAKEYGSIDKYLEQELELTPQKREKLKEIMLYQRIN